MDPATHPSLFTGRTRGLKRARCAFGGPVATDLFDFLVAGKTIDQPFTRRTLILIIFSDIAERAPWELAFRSLGRRVRLGDIRHDVLGLARQQFLTSVVALIGNHL
jgi:hypothetical protein